MFVLDRYTAETVIAGNEVQTVPNTAISMGWGWGRGPNMSQLETVMRGNRVTRNRCHAYKQVLNDGGCVYTQVRTDGTGG